MVKFRRPAVRTGALLLISIGLWACAGCSSTGPADKSEAEVPARSYCTPLSGDPLPSMCSPHGHTTVPAPGRAAAPAQGPGHPPVAPREGRVARGTGTPPGVDVTRETGGTVPVTVDEPVSPELMPEAPFSAWGVPVPRLPESDVPVPPEPVPLEHAGQPLPPVAEEPVSRYEEAVPPDPEPTPSGTPVAAALDA